ncbi:MAG: branched-chain amino acid transport system permease protein [Moorella sp. (in: firmicutes)]|jgi:branched-chain amino acid transport system permease protein|uniref:branched-chain amino acid ABC transporter permease n=1 Tax=unclassified Neomoorella TaxID=2676739 RepID=UPI0010FFB14D|nr:MULTISPECIES: branched-chain amino acid ABC transporter permease [unclassified Moorella (in: firmicutes)]MDK2817352.1 branched-chain amino acid transport system permease protein [Moorella sp. (in: firmicutes)]MDK2894136.1 branched-chain amino acid transport system permease protein [Moorella sp. (in: firmicutes)]GEA14439.1 branched-chain amino acid ABC transporter permease [Moorella sp. E308F]GEA18189.1 branched-chain amino acid ABC transporter permease [Moorella sp. E306M]
MAVFLQQIINGLSLGSIYALIALGYTMVYGIIQLINFAHGDILMVGAYIAFFVVVYLKLNIWLAFIISMIGTAILGVLIERVAYRPLRNAGRLAPLITAIGVSLFLENGGLMVLGTEIRSYPAGLITSAQLPLAIFGIKLTATTLQLLILAITIAMMVILQYIVHYTWAGKAMRAVSYDPDAARLMGINVDNTISLTFAIGSTFAAVAGVLLGLYYNTIQPLMGIMPGLKAFVAAVIGGIGLIPGAMVGGFALGIFETMVSGYWSSKLRDPIVFLLLILILLVKPSGLLGKNNTEKV